MSSPRDSRGTHRRSRMPVIYEDTTAPSLPLTGIMPSHESLIGSDKTVDPSNLAKFKSWSPAEIETILDFISSPEFEKETTGIYATKRLRQQLNSLHEVVEEVPPLGLKPESLRADVIKAMKTILDIRLDSLLRLYIP